MVSKTCFFIISAGKNSKYRTIDFDEMTGINVMTMRYTHIHGLCFFNTNHAVNYRELKNKIIIEIVLVQINISSFDYSFCVKVIFLYMNDYLNY